jgi:hypothetical protein
MIFVFAMIFRRLSDGMWFWADAVVTTKQHTNNEAISRNMAVTAGFWPVASVTELLPSGNAC